MVNNRRYKNNLLFVTVVIFIFIYIIYIIKRPFPNENTLKLIDPSSSWTKCRHVTIKELDEWFDSGEWDGIPKIIHQSWKNETLRERQKQWSQTWCNQYTNWRYHLWTDDENDLFVRTKFPWFYPTFQQLSPAILKVDSVRYLYMLYYGGLYIDLDYKSIRRADHLFNNKSVILSLINYSFNSTHSVPNSWMASQPHHPLWTYILYRIMILWSRATDQERNEYWGGRAEFFTGPNTLFDGLMFYIHSNLQTDQSLDQLFGNNQNQTSDSILEVANITFLGPRLMNAYDWMNGIGRDVCSAERPTFNENICKEIVKPIYGITYWSHSYGHGHENDANYLRTICLHCNRRLCALHVVNHGAILLEEANERSEQLNEVAEHISVYLQQIQTKHNDAIEDLSQRLTKDVREPLERMQVQKSANYQVLQVMRQALNGIREEIKQLQWTSRESSNQFSSFNIQNTTVIKSKKTKSDDQHSYESNSSKMDVQNHAPIYSLTNQPSSGQPSPVVYIDPKQNLFSNMAYLPVNSSGFIPVVRHPSEHNQIGTLPFSHRPQLITATSTLPYQLGFPQTIISIPSPINPSQLTSTDSSRLPLDINRLPAYPSRKLIDLFMNVSDSNEHLLRNFISKNLSRATHANNMMVLILSFLES
ncbi:unnamed protein product [Adineta steineri]|uniref:Uncharacterized protein n=2 Tax=Adineta steineri TaxID=433720 RepID=A0A819JD93_9BILA|nr:unnamed protein product [Adineta steineri]